MSENPGVVFLIVGPSGVGKDSLIKGAQAALARESRFVFPRRLITRPRTNDAESHHPVSQADFDRLRAERAFCLDWRAYGLSYGIPVEAEHRLLAGCNLVINVSRRIIGAAQKRFPRVVVVSVIAGEDQLSERLQQRGREDEGQRQARLSRTDHGITDAQDLRILDNSKSLALGVGELVAILTQTETPGDD